MRAPHNNDGPFVQNSTGPGLLRRLLGGGANDPTSPHEHREASTSEMHDRPLTRTGQTTGQTTGHATPVAPRTSPFGTAGTDTFGGSRAGTQRPLFVRVLIWLVRHPRIAITAIALLLVFIGQASDSDTQLEQATEGLRDMQTQLEEGTFSSGDVTVPDVADPAAPEGMVEASSFRATITQVRGDDVTIRAGGSTFTWKFNSPLVYAALTRNLDQDVLLHWELRGSQVFVTGLEGPNGSVDPQPA